jgi:hypothetical protein
MKDLDQFALDRVLVAFSLYEDQKRHACNIKADRCIEVISSIGPCNSLVESNLQIIYKRISRANQLLGNELFELGWRDVSLDDSGCGRGWLLIGLCRFSAVVSGWRVAVLPDVLGAAPAPTAPGRLLSGSQGRDSWSGGCWQGT